jgi:hypothetical protein
MNLKAKNGFQEVPGDDEGCLSRTALNKYVKQNLKKKPLKYSFKVVFDLKSKKL